MKTVVDNLFSRSVLGFTIAAITAGAWPMTSFAAATVPPPQKAGKPAKSVQQTIAEVDRDFAAMDANKDGMADQAEFRTSLRKKYPEIDAKKLDDIAIAFFARLDRNKNGSVSKAEALQVALEDRARK
jgi:hypothetical protein